MIAPTAELTELRYTAEDPDVRLMLRVRDGDPNAFEQLVHRHHASVVRIIGYLLGNHQHSEDLAQEVYLRVYRARATYRPQSKFCTWLFTIVNNVVHTAKRKLSRRKEFQPNSQFGDHGASANPISFLAVATQHEWPSRGLESNEVREIVHSAISLLNRRQRRAIELRHLQGLSHVEIALQLNTSPEAIKSLLHRAIENLREHLQPYVQEGHAVSPRTVRSAATPGRRTTRRTTKSSTERESTCIV